MLRLLPPPPLPEEEEEEEEGCGYCATDWFGLHPPSVLFVPQPPPIPSLRAALASSSFAALPPLKQQRTRRRRRVVDAESSSRYGFVSETRPTPSAFAGLLGTLSFAPQVRAPERWWVVVFLKTPTRPRAYLTPDALRERLATWRLRGPLLSARADARAFATFERNLRRAKGHTRLFIEELPP